MSCFLLEDALNLCALRDRGIDAVLNCARDDCPALTGSNSCNLLHCKTKQHAVAKLLHLPQLPSSRKSFRGEAEIACFKPQRCGLP